MEGGPKASGKEEREGGKKEGTLSLSHVPGVSLVLPSGPLKDGWILVSRDEAGERGNPLGRTVESARIGSKSWLHLAGWVITRCYSTSLSLSFHPCENGAVTPDLLGAGGDEMVWDCPLCTGVGTGGLTEHTGGLAGPDHWAQGGAV